MFLARALKRGYHPHVNILKFNVPGGRMPLFRALAKNMADWKMFGKNYLTVIPQKWDLCMYLLCCLQQNTLPLPVEDCRRAAGVDETNNIILNMKSNVFPVQIIYFVQFANTTIHVQQWYINYEVYVLWTVFDLNCSYISIYWWQKNNKTEIN
jgi:hypothetical protein